MTFMPFGKRKNLFSKGFFVGFCRKIYFGDFVKAIPRHPFLCYTKEDSNQRGEIYL